MGRIVGAHGLSGTVRLLCDSPQSLLHYKLFLSDSSLPSDSRLWVAERVWERPPMLKLQGVNSRTEAEALIDKFLLVARADLAPLPPDQYYWHDLIGCRVEDTDGLYKGKIASIANQGGGDVALLDEACSEINCILLSEEWVEKVDLSTGRVVVKKEFWA